jgi:hypothetical protein
MSVKDRRAGAKAAGVSLKDYKAGNTGAKAVARKTTQAARNNPAPSAPGYRGPAPKNSGRMKPGQGQSSPIQGGGGGNGTYSAASPSTNTFTTAAGYEMESGAYNARSKEMYETYKAANPKAGTSNMTPDNASFDADGYLSYDSTKPQWQANDLLKKAGYKAGDMLWKPGALDNLNGRKLTGRIASVSGGIYTPEYEHDAVNSSHKSTGNAGYGGEVGLGADQYDYNRQYEQDYDVESGQVDQQLEANGYSAQEHRGFNSGQSEHEYGGEQYESDYANFGSEQGNPAFEAPKPRGNDQHSVQQSNGPQYQDWQQQISSMQYQNPYSTKPGKTKSSGMNFNFDPYKFSQGQ